MRGSDTELGELAGTLADRLLAHGWSVVTAESCTGGWIAKVLTDIPGSSRWFGFGFVSYANAAKERLLDVPRELLAHHGAVSEPVVRSMAERARQIAGAEVALAVSGIAGPDGGTPEKPLGTVWLAWAVRERISVACHRFAGERDDVRRQAVAAALAGLVAAIDGRGA